MNTRKLNSLIGLFTLLFNLLPANTPPVNAGAEAKLGDDARQSTAERSLPSGKPSSAQPPFGIVTASLRESHALLAAEHMLPAWFTPPASAGEPVSASSPHVTSAGAALPAWFVPPPSSVEPAPATPLHAASTAATLPAWFADVPADAAHTPASTAAALPGWFVPPAAPPASPPLWPAGETIPPADIQVIPSSLSIDNCQPVSFTVIITNSGTTSNTDVVITNSMPAGFSPVSQSVVVTTLLPGQSASRTFAYNATCDAVSGQNTTQVSTAQGNNGIARLDFVVNPGAITIRKEPAVIPARLDDVVTWTITVENTGYGSVSNVVVTDTWGSGLQYISGLTSASIPTIAAGGLYTFPFVARVVGCSGLENEASATWGCFGRTCLNAQSAKGAVDLQLDNPDLRYTLPSFDVPFCSGSAVFTVPVHNYGQGTAYLGALTTDLSPFSLTVGGAATYDGVAFHLPPITSGVTYDLVFTLSLPTGSICSLANSGSFGFDLTYYDRCNHPYTTPPQDAAWNLINVPGQLSVSKSMPGEVYRGDNVPATINVTADGITSSVVVTDQVPSGWSVVDPAGGTVFTVAGTSYVTWAFNLSGSRVLTPVFGTPGATITDCTACGLPATNHVTVTGSDCQNCQRTASASASTEVQCHEPVVTSDKQVSGPAVACANPAYTYTNTYTMAGSFTVTPTWQGLVFTDTLPNQSYAPGTANVWVSDGVTGCAATFSESSVGGNLVIYNIAPTCAISVPGATLVISYSTALGDSSPCADSSFYDWSYLDLGVTGNAECSIGGVLQEGVSVGTQAPSMVLELSGLPDYVSSCGDYTITLTARRTSAVAAYDAVIDVPTTTFYILEVLGFGGATPVTTTADANGYHFYYDDSFVAGITATVQLHVQLRCGESAPFAAILWYDNLCTDNDTYREECSTGGALASPPVIASNPFLTKFPEVIFAQGDIVTWTLTAFNSGAGPAYNVVLTDTLGSGLRYWDSAIGSSQGSAAGVVPVTSPTVVAWNLPAILPLERAVITYQAAIVGCADLTNVFVGTQGCQGQNCLSFGPEVSHVELPPTVLINTNQALTPIDTCATRTVTVTVRNAGLLSVYSATLTETLPLDLQYIAGSTEYVTGTGITPPTGGWIGGAEPAGAPAGPLVWTANEISALNRVYPEQTVWVRFNVYINCPFDSGSIVIQTGYRDTCGTPYQTAASSYLMQANRPDLSLEKMGRNVTTGGPWTGVTEPVYAEPGDVVVWRLIVGAGGASGHAEQVVLTDTLPANMVFVGASPAPDLVSSGVISWAIGTLQPGGGFTAYITATVLNDGCTVNDEANTARVQWGCPPTPWQPLGCAGEAIVRSAQLRTRPLIASSGIDIAPTALHRCGDDVTVTLDNQGPPAYLSALTVTLPNGYVYSGTVGASTAPIGAPTPGDNPAAWQWTVLPSGPTTLTFAIRNTTSGGCATPTGPITAFLVYEDHNSCAGTVTYSTTHVQDMTINNPVLIIDKSPFQQTAGPGRTVTWTLRVTNSGSADAPGVVITDAVTDNGFSSWNVVAPAPGSGSGRLADPWVWTRTIPAGGAFVATINAVVVDVGVQRNYAGAVGYCQSGCIYDSADTVAYVTQQENFAKDPPVQTGTIGSLVTFTFRADLPRIGRLYQDLRLTDTLPAGLGFVSASLTLADAGGGPTTTLPSSQPAYLSAGNIAWQLGDRPGPAQLSGVVVAVIQDIPTNAMGVSRTNVLNMTFFDDVPYFYTDDARVDIVEPVLHIGKSYGTPYGCLAALWVENFNDGVANGVSTAGTWAVTNGYYQNTNATAGSRMAFFGTQTWTDYSYSFMVRPAAGTGTIGAYVRQNAAGASDTGYRLAWTSTQMQLQSQPAGTTLATTNFGFTPGRWYHVEIRAVGGLIQVFVDGVQRLQASNTAFSQGRVGLYVNTNQGTQFDDLLVTRLGAMACTVAANDLVTYTLSISNQGQLAGHDLVITDAIPAGTSLEAYTFQSDDPSAAVVAQPVPIPGATGILTWGVNQLTGTLPVNPLAHPALTLTVVLRVSPDIAANTTLVNQASLGYDAWPGSTQPTTITRQYSGGSHSTAIRTVDGGIAKSVTFSPPPTATLGTLVTYTLIVPPQPISATLYNLVVTDTLDARLRVEDVSASAPAGVVITNANGLANSLRFLLSHVPSGGQAFITVTARIPDEWPSPAGDANAGDTIANTAWLTHSTATVITRSNTVTTTVGEPRVSIAKTASALADPQTAIYTLTLSNSGSSPAHSLVITDNLPAGMAVIDISDGGVLWPDGRTVTWTLPAATALPVGGSLTLTYTAQLSQVIYGGSWFTNTAFVGNTSLTDTIPGVRSYVTDTVHTFTWPLGRLGDTVWYDYDYDGVQGSHPSEHGIAGVIIDLYNSDTGSYITSTTTDASGLYLFDNLPLGVTYTVRISDVSYAPGGPLAAYTQTLLAIGSPASDSDASIAATFQGLPYAITQSLTTAFTQDLTLDYGFVQLVSLGNQVWYDVDDNGALDAGEAGVPGVAVELYQDTNGDGVFSPGVDRPVSTTLTDAGGYYTFTELAPSAYITQAYLVVITATNFTAGGVLADYQNSDGSVGGNSDLNDQDHGVPTGTLGSGGYVASDAVTLIAGTEPVNDGDLDSSSNLSIDFGFYQLSLGDQVWYDANNNGLLDSGELGAPGVTVRLLDATGTGVLGTTTTDAGGFYTFTNLVSGTYRVEIDLPAAYTSSTDIATSATPDNNVDSDDNGVQFVGATVVRSGPVTLVPGDVGAQGANDVVVETGSTHNPTLDFGLVQTVSLGNQVWYDVNDNGVLDTGEAGVPGVAVELYQDTNGDGQYTLGVDQLISTMTTIAGGYYTFTDLLPSRYPTETYLVVITSTNFTAGGVLAGYASSTGSVEGNSDLNDRDHGAVIGTLGAGGYVASTPVSLTVGGEPTNDGDLDANTNLTIDFGFYAPGRIGDYVWVDLNRDGIQAAGETPIPGVAVDLYDSATGAYLTSTTTDASGLYLFSDLPLDVTYVVQLSSANFTAGGALYPYVPTLYGGAPFDNTDSNADATALFNGSGYAVTTTLTQDTRQDLTLDFGFNGGRIGDYVWADVDSDGIQGTDSGEFGIGGVVVDLYDTNTGAFITSTVTDGSGLYLFDNLALNVDYTVQLAQTNFLPGGALYPYVPTLLHVGSAATDSDADATALFNGFGYAVNTTLTTAITEDLTLDFGLVMPPTLSLVKQVTPAGTVTPGQQLTYTLCYSNAGQQPATGVVITDYVPANTTYVPGSATPPLSSGPDPLIWDIGTLAGGASGCVTFAVQISMTIQVNGLSLTYTPQGWALSEPEAVTPTVQPPIETETPVPAPSPETETPAGTVEATSTPTPQPTAEQGVTPAAETSTPTVSPTAEITPSATLEPTPSAVPTPSAQPPIGTPTETAIPQPAVEQSEPTPTLEITPAVETPAAVSWRVPGRAAPLWQQGDETLTPTPTPTPTAGQEVSPEPPPGTPSPTAEPLPAETETPSASGTPADETETPTPTETATEAATLTETPTPTETGVATETPIPTATGTEVATETPIPTATETQAVTVTATVDLTPVITSTPVETVTITPTPVVTVTPAVTVTPVITIAPSSGPEVVPFETYQVFIVNTATIDSNETSTRTSTVTNTLISRVDPVVSKAVEPTQAHPGDVVTFTLSVLQNPGSNSNATNVQVVDILPIYVDILSVDVSGGVYEVTGRVCTWTIPVLAPSQVEHMVIRTVVNANASPPPVTMRNQATLHFDQGGPRTSNVVTVQVPRPPRHDDHDDEDEDEPTATPVPDTPPAVAPTPTPTPAILYLPETGAASPSAAAWWVIAMALAVLAVALVWRPKSGR